MTGRPCPVCCAQEYHVMQKEDGSEGICNSCGYAWGIGGYEISDERKLQHLRIAYTLLQEGAKQQRREAARKLAEIMDLWAADQVSLATYKRQMEALAWNYTADEKRWREHDGQRFEELANVLTKLESPEIAEIVRKWAKERHHD